LWENVSVNLFQSEDENEDNRQDTETHVQGMADDVTESDIKVELSASPRDTDGQEDGELLPSSDLADPPKTEYIDNVETVNMAQDGAQNYDEEEIEGRIDLGYDDEDDDDDHSGKHSDRDDGGASAQSYGRSNTHSRDGSHQRQDDDDENFDLYEDVGGALSANEEEKEAGFPKEVDLKLKDDDSRRNFRAEVAAPVSDLCKVTVSQLQWWTSDAVLEEFFASCGRVRKITFSEDRSNGKSNGSAMIEFSDRSVKCKPLLSFQILIDDLSQR
jgi:hypothetical protein